jgi:hypothetical protein
LRVLLTTRRNAVNARIQAINQLKALIVSAPKELLTAAQVLISWSHAGRWRSEAAFAALAGTSPIPASSERVTRYRLNRRGDRQLTTPLHTIAVVRLRDDPLTRAHTQRRTAQGKNPREIKWCLKRIIARQLYKVLERYDRPTVEITHIPWRTSQPRDLPNDAALLRLTGMLLIEQNDQWQVTRRYLSRESLGLVLDNKPTARRSPSSSGLSRPVTPPTAT